MNVGQEKKVNVLVKSKDKDLKFFIENNEKDILFLAKAESIKFGADIEKPKGAAGGADEICEVYLPLEGILDIDKELSRLNKELEKIKIDYEKTDKKLHDKNFISRAPKEVIQKEKGKLEEFKSRLEKLESNITTLKKIN